MLTAPDRRLDKFGLPRLTPRSTPLPHQHLRPCRQSLMCRARIRARPAEMDGQDTENGQGKV